jgi:hypothetical protein
MSVGDNARMPNVTVKTGLIGPDGKQETLTEYLCDSPNCPNIATQMVGCVNEIRLCIALCNEHAAQLGHRL